MAEARSIQRTAMGSQALVKKNHNNNGTYESNKAGHTINQIETG